MRVLVVDDNRDCADTIAVLLQHLGHDCRVSYSADAGLADALAVRPQLILLDLAMPSKDGYALIRELRNGSGLADIPVAAMTGYADSDHRNEAIKNGFVAYLVKPCRIDDLRDLLRAIEASADE